MMGDALTQPVTQQTRTQLYTHSGMSGIERIEEVMQSSNGQKGMLSVSLSLIEKETKHPLRGSSAGRNTCQGERPEENG